MKIKNDQISLVFLIVLLTTFLSSTNVSGKSDEILSLGTIELEAKKLNLYNTSYGYTQTLSKEKVTAFSNSLFVLGLLKENEIKESSWAIQESRRMLVAIKQYLKDSVFVEKRGYLSYYEINAPGEWERTSRLARDQALIALGFSKGVSIFSDTNTQNLFRDYAIETLEFLNDTFRGSNGWGKGFTPFTQTDYANDTTIDVADNSLIMLVMVEMLPFINEQINNGVREFYLQECILINEFIYNNAKNSAGDLVDKITQDGTPITDTVSCRTNALYGLANIRLFEETADQKYLLRAETILQLINELFKDEAFNGFFTAARYLEDTGKSVISLWNKRLTDNILTYLLATLVLRNNNTNEIAREVFLNLAELLPTTYIGMMGIDCASVNWQLLPDEVYSFGSSSDKLWALSQLPHIHSVSSPEEVERGDSFNAKINLYSPLDIDLTVNVTGSQINERSDVYDWEQDLGEKIMKIKVPDSADTGDTSVQVTVSYLNRIIAQVDFPLKIKSEGILIPRGVIFVIGAGGLGALALLIKYPPDQIKKILETVFEEQQEEPPPIKIKKEE